MRACLHCRSYLWNWAILNGALWLKETGKEVIKAETTEKWNSDIRCIIGEEKYIFVTLPSPLVKWAVNLYSCIFFSWEGSYISKVILDWIGGKKKKESQSRQFLLATQIFLPKFQKGAVILESVPFPLPLSPLPVFQNEAFGLKTARELNIY